MSAAVLTKARTLKMHQVRIPELQNTEQDTANRATNERNWNTDMTYVGRHSSHGNTNETAGYHRGSFRSPFQNLIGVMKAETIIGCSQLAITESNMAAGREEREYCCCAATTP
jgi:hypothetical protein